MRLTLEISRATSKLGSLVHALTEPGAKNAVEFDRRIDDRASQSVDFFIPALFLASWRSWRLDDLSTQCPRRP